MCPQAGLYSKADAEADIAVHAALTDTHGVTTAIADTDDIAAHAVGSAHRWTDEKLRKGAGAAADPDEISIPVGGTPVRKTADQTVNNSDTPVDDLHLLFPLGANEVWEFTFLILNQQAVDTADWTYSVTCPGGGTVLWANMETWSKSLVALYTSGEELDIVNAITTLTGTMIKGIVYNGATPGNLQLQWAQKTATVGDNTVKEGSLLIVRPVS